MGVVAPTRRARSRVGRRGHQAVAEHSSGMPPGLGYVAGLDGLRSLALLAVMAFHHGFPAAPGGYLGVSSFFTLSGFLITSRATAEHRRTGALSWRGFWERRVRRLLPAALVTLTAVLALQAWWAVGSGPRFRGDALGAVAYAANWRQASAPGGYAAVFSTPSPLVHFWSLAVEEQFYVLFPIVFAGATAVLGARSRRRAVLFGAAALASFAAAWVSADRAGSSGVTYYGTHTRAGELLVGVALACALADGRRHRVGAGRPVGRAGTAVAGATALAGLAVLWSRVAIGDERLFHGVTLLNAALTAAVIWATVASRPFDRALGIAPLRAVGRISYGAYLFHWPLFLVLTADRTGVDGRALFGLRTAVTLGAAALSYAVVEAPFRFRLPMPRPRLAALAACGTAAVVALAVGLPQHRAPYADLASASSALSTAAPALGPEAGTGGGAGPITNVRMVGAVSPEDGPPDAGTVLLAGDSVAWSLLAGFVGWNRDNGDRTLQVDSHTAFGCPAGGAGTTRVVIEQATFPDCAPWHAELAQAIDRSSPDVIVLAMGLADLGGRPLDGQWRLPGDPAHDRWLLGRLDALATTMEQQGVPVVWLTFPHIRLVDTGDPTRPWSDIPVNDPARVDRFNQLLRETVARHPGIELLDLAAWVDTWPNGSFDPHDRDGVHFSFAGSEKVAAWLAPQLLARLPS
jgi:peptidoglycan/LPS O-acetylase OafA/YrhL/lysophospholipase L1-like esterase